jgi:CHAT domain-containing protein
MASQRCRYSRTHDALLQRAKKKKSLSRSEALHNAQTHMRELDQDGLFELTSELKALFPPGGVEHQDYVFPAKYHLDVLQSLLIDGLKEPRCWAAFALTGYDCKPLY